jgi:hypothetical protein
MEAIGGELSEHFRWVVYLGLAAGAALSLTAILVFLELSRVRPMLVFVMVDGQLPPICGFCVLFGVHPI